MPRTVHDAQAGIESNCRVGESGGDDEKWGGGVRVAGGN